MSEETQELIRAFFRKWSTIELTDESRPHFSTDIIQLTVLLDILGYKGDFPGDLEQVTDRQEVARRYNELVSLVLTQE